MTNVDYIHNRNVGRIGTMIFMVWAAALVVSVAPLLGWKDEKFIERIYIQQRCIVSQDISFQICATMATFYIPLTVILFLYYRIFQTARRRIRRRQHNVNANAAKGHQNWFKQHFSRRSAPSSPPTQEHVCANGVAVVDAATEASVNGVQGVQTTAFTIDISCDAKVGSDADASNLARLNNGSSLALTAAVVDADVKAEAAPIATAAAGAAATTGTPAVNPFSAKETRRKRETLEAKREKKAAKTLVTPIEFLCFFKLEIH